MSSDHSKSKLQVLAYERLSNYFQLHDNHVLEIEVLPPAIEPADGFLLVDGSNLGVPKKILALAYVEARKRFFQHANSQDSRSIALLATKIILLFDPEHLTAANLRKRYLLSLKAESSVEGQAVYRKAIKHEFCFLDSILTSPLHRQSKSPNLWHHRLWLLDIMCPPNIMEALNDNKHGFWQRELDAVCKSGQQHPKNYYAWQYARRLISRFNTGELALKFAQHVKTWCCKHPGDISGWTFLVYVLHKVDTDRERKNLIHNILDYAIDFRCENESIWVFLQIVLADNILPEAGRAEMIIKLHTHCRNVDDGSKESDLYQLVTKSLAWIEANITNPQNG